MITSKSVLFPWFLLTLLFGQKEVSIDCLMSHVVQIQLAWSRFGFSIMNICLASNKSELHVKIKCLEVKFQKKGQILFPDFHLMYPQPTHFCFQCNSLSKSILDILVSVV